jgi:hypothetical protein
VLDKPQPSQTEKLVGRAVDRVSTPLDAYLLTSNYASGHITRTYYDPKTYLVERVERVAAGRLTFTDYDDFRTDEHGRTRPWHYSGGSDRSEDAFDYRLRTDYVDRIVDDADVAVPQDRRSLIEFPAGQTVVRLPARIEGDRIYVRVTIGERGFDLLLDTGSYGLGLNERIIKELGLEIQGRLSSAGGAFSSGRVVVPAMNVGKLALHDVVMATVPIDSNETADTRVVGVLGFDFIAHAVFRIDYEHGTVDAILPSSFAPPATAVALPVTLNTQTPHVEVSVGGSTSPDFLIDTGAPGSLLLFRRFLTTHDADPSIVAAFRSEAPAGSIRTMEGPTPVAGSRCATCAWARIASISTTASRRSIVTPSVAIPRTASSARASCACSTCTWIMRAAASCSNPTPATPSHATTRFRRPKSAVPAPALFSPIHEHRYAGRTHRCGGAPAQDVEQGAVDVFPHDLLVVRNQHDDE